MHGIWVRISPVKNVDSEQVRRKVGMLDATRIHTIKMMASTGIVILW